MVKIVDIGIPRIVLCRGVNLIPILLKFVKICSNLVANCWQSELEDPAHVMIVIKVGFLKLQEAGISTSPGCVAVPH